MCKSHSLVKNLLLCLRHILHGVKALVVSDNDQKIGPVIGEHFLNSMFYGRATLQYQGHDHKYANN